MSEWISVKDRLPPENQPVICYGNQMSSHWPDIAYATWNTSKEHPPGYWINCFSYGGDEVIRKEEVDFWLDIKLPPGRHV